MSSVLPAPAGPVPFWRRLKAVAHTLPYDYAALGDDTGRGEPLPAYRWKDIAMPVLVMAGGKSPVSMRNAMPASSVLLYSSASLLDQLERSR